MKRIAIVFGTSTGTTEDVANRLHSLIKDSDLFNAENVDPKVLENYDVLIFGTSTQGVGDLQDDWEGLLPKIEKLDLKSKKLALFGLGDSASFSTSFVGSLYHLYKSLKDKTTIVGEVSPEGYSFEASEAIENGKFVGLPIDEDNEPDKTEDRLKEWVEQLKKEF